MKKSQKELQEEFERLTKIMQVKSKEWQKRWDSILCPFMKVKDMNSPEFVAEREAVLGPWREAKALAKARRGVA